MAEVVFNHVTKCWGKVIGLKDINFKIRDSEFFTLLGPSGCGKSTVLNMIAGLEKPTEGVIKIGDEIVNDLPPKDRDIAMVFQSYAIYPHMAIRENIAFPLKLRKYPPDEIERRVNETAKLLEIEPLLDRKPKELSGGQRQRVALGRALVRRPKVFLMDEPLSNLDAKLRVYMRGEIKKLHEKLGVTTVYVTHDQAEAMTMADRVCLINHGIIQQIGTPTDMYDHPKNLFVAGFLGSPPMNFIRGTFKEADGKAYFATSTFSYEIPEAMASKIEKGMTSKEIILGVRPEDIDLFRDERPKTIEGVVYVIEPMGSELLVSMKIGDDKIIAKTPPTFVAKTDEHLWVNFDNTRIHFFDTKTEVTII
jgi:multiple sugar transport system ATP-binding protein